MLVTAGGGASSGTWTINRGVDGTNPVAHAANWTAQQVIGPGTLGNFKQASNAATTAVTITTSTTETVLASYTPLTADIEAGATFEVVAFGPLTGHGGTSRGTVAFNLYWGGSGAPGAAFTSTGSAMLASLKTNANMPALAATTIIAGASFDVNGTITLLSSTTATANLNCWYQGGATLATAPSQGVCNNVTTSGGASSSTAVTISGGGPIILTAVFAAGYTVYGLTATAPLIFREA